MRPPAKISAALAVFISLILLSQISIVPASATPKIPLIKISTGISIPEVFEVADFIRFQQGFLVAGNNSEDRNLLSFIDEKGALLWSANPLGIQRGFITGMAVSGTSIFVAGISQGELKIAPSANGVAPTPDASVSAAPTTNASPSASSSASAAKNIPLVNPDGVIVGAKETFREDIANLFLAEIDSSGKVIAITNVTNEKSFIPTSLATAGNRVFLAGNEYPAEGVQLGALYVISSAKLQASYSYGEKRTQFNKIIARSSKNLLVVGSSSDVLADRKLAGKIDAVALTISTTSGKIEKILRSSGKGAVRTWDFATGNLTVAGTSEVKKIRESVITAFSTTGSVTWTARFQKSNRAAVAGNCVAVSILGGSKSLTFTPSGPEIFLFTVDSKGRLQKGVRVAKQQLISLATTVNKGCAVLTYSAETGVRVSFL
jgi:hypothetical protein